MIKVADFIINTLAERGIDRCSSCTARPTAI